MMRRAAPVLALLLVVLGCGGTLREQSGGTADFERAKAAFDRGDWIESSLGFKSYVEQYPGTDRTDDALYYLGLSYFQNKEYALASAQFDRLTRDFPQSPFAADAMYYLARCDDVLSRRRSGQPRPCARSSATAIPPALSRERHAAEAQAV